MSKNVINIHDIISSNFNFFNVYLDDTEFLGTANIEIPDIKSAIKVVMSTETANSSKTIHTRAITLDLKWVFVTESADTLTRPKGHCMSLIGRTHFEHPFSQRAIFFTIKGIPKKIDLIKSNTGQYIETTTEFELYYFKLIVENIERIEIDKLNYKFVVDGVDYLYQLRKVENNVNNI